MKSKKTGPKNSSVRTPKFANEADEARWWHANQDEVAGLLEKAAKRGSLGRGTVARKGITPTTTIRLHPDDVSLAREQAEKKGLRYQTYLKMLIREALRSEQRKAG